MRVGGSQETGPLKCSKVRSVRVGGMHFANSWNCCTFKHINASFVAWGGVEMGEEIIAFCGEYTLALSSNGILYKS